MNREQLLNELNEIFPEVEKPKGLAMSFHKVGCFQCEKLREDFAHIKGAFPEEELRTIYDELSCLSSEGILWVIPTYLKRILNTKASVEADEIEIEFFIYNFAPELKYQKDAISRLSSLSKVQRAFIGSVFEWLGTFPYWSEWHGKDIEKAKVFLRNVNA